MGGLLNLSFWEHTLWLQQIAALVTILGIPAAFLIFIFYKTRFKIYFKKEETYHEVMLVDHYNQPQSLWLQLMVKNRGLETARKAEAYLSRIWKKSDKGKFISLGDFRAPVKLKWSHEANIYPIDILPRYARRLDICYICESEKVLYLMAESFASGTIKNNLIPDNYVFEIVVVSENSVKPAKFLFEVQWDGRWKTLKGDKHVKSFKLKSYPVQSFLLY